MMKVSGVVVVIAALPFTLPAASLTYYPKGASAPFNWSTSANWYATPSALNIMPDAEGQAGAYGALPTESDDVVINVWGGISPSTPVVIGNGETVTVNNLDIARHHGSNKPRYGLGASLTVDGGTLNVLGTFRFCSSVYAYGTLILSNGSEMKVSGDAQLGENDRTTEGHCRMEVDKTSSFTVSGDMTVGRRTRSISNVVTNYGSISAGSLQIGPAGDVNAGTGIVHNAGSLSVVGNLDIGGRGMGGSGGVPDNYCWSRGELVLAENSTLSLGESATISVGGSDDKSYGDGILDTSIPIVLTGAQNITIGNAYKDALNGGVLILRGNARLDNSSSTLDIGASAGGKAAIRMFGNSSITNVSKLLFGDLARVEASLEMHDQAVITNVTNIRLSEQTGQYRYGSKAHILLDGSSAIRFTCTEQVNAGSGFIFGTCASNETYLTVKDNAEISGLYRLNASTVYFGLKTIIRFEGGRMVFNPQNFSTRRSISLGRAENGDKGGVGSISGYGTFTRSDSESPSTKKYMPMVCRMHDFAFTADGMGEERDLDMSAISHFNDACYGNLTGTNGWYAVNKGRLLYPRGHKTVGKTLDNPAMQVGDYCFPGTNQYGEANSPSLVNAFTMEPADSALESRVAYCYAALYAPDRTDYPNGVLRGRDGKVVSVWRIGTSTTMWHTAEPESPWTDWTRMKVTFRYDRGAAVDGMPLKLYHHDGTADGKWRCVARLDAPSEDALVSGTVEPSQGTWNVGWFALVSQMDAGMVLILK